MKNYTRQGNVLSSQRILLRIDFKIYSINDISKGLNLKSKDKISNNIVLLNTFNQVHVNINNDFYVLIDKNEIYNNNSDEIINFTKEILEKNEKNLIEEIYHEFSKNSELLVHFDSGNNLRGEYLKNIEILTFEKFMKKFEFINYYHLPLSQSNYGLNNMFIDKIKEVFDVNYNSGKDLYVLSSTNSENLIFCKNLYDILIYHQTKTHSNVNYKVEMELDAIKYYESNLINNDNEVKFSDAQKDLIIKGLKFELKVVLNLITALKHTKYKTIVDSIIDKLPIEHNIRYNAISCFLFEKEKNTHNIQISRYCIYLLLIYYLENEIYKKKTSFHSFVTSDLVFCNLLKYIKIKRKTDDLVAPVNNIYKFNSYNMYNPLSNIYGVLIFNQKKIMYYFNNLNAAKKKFMGCLYKNTSEQLLINLREEPCIVVDDMIMTLRNVEKFNKNSTYLRGANNETIELIEDKIKKDLIKSIEKQADFKYYKCCNDQLQEHSIKNLIIDKIFTLKEYFTCEEDLKYIRIPITPSMSFRFSIFDRLINVLKENFDFFEEQKNIYLYSNSDKGRSNFVAIVLDLLREDYKNLDTKDSPESLFIEQISLLSLIMGEESKFIAIVEKLFERHFGEKFINYIKDFKKPKSMVRSIKKFFLIIVFSYWYNIIRKSDNETFESWIITRSDIINLYKSINVIIMKNLMKLYNLEEEYDSNVLSSHIILKNDYFIGSFLFKVYDQIKGVQNFRYVKIDSNLIVGTSMPTVTGIKNTIGHILKSYENIKKIIWICLREEPVVFINGSPYVLRFKYKKNHNIEITGITHKSIDRIEKMVVDDIKKRQYVILHDEIVQNQEVMSVTKNIKLKTIKTTENIYTKHNITYHRIPITDEKSPLVHIFDLYHSIVIKNNENVGFVMNCQIGKGRTTTFMILTRLILNINSIIVKTVYETKYKHIDLLYTILPNSKNSKNILDVVIDEMEHLENFREVIEQKIINGEYNKAKDFLKRYIYLICFTYYLSEKKYSTFSLFMDHYQGINTLFRKIEDEKLELIGE